MTYFPQATFDRPVIYPPAAPQAPASSPVEVPEKPPLLQIVQKVSKYFLAVFLAVIGVGSLAVGITLTPFAPQAGTATLAFSTALLGASACIIYSETSTS